MFGTDLHLLFQGGLRTVHCKSTMVAMSGTGWVETWPHSLRETTKSDFHRIQLLFRAPNLLRLTATDHFSGLWVSLSDPQQSRNWPWNLSHVCFDLTFLRNLSTLLNPEAKSFWQTPGFVIPMLPCAIFPALCAAPLDLQPGHGPEALSAPDFTHWGWS